PRCSCPATPSSIWWPICWRAERPRASIVGSSTRRGWRPRWRRFSSRASRRATSRWWRPRLRDARWRRSSRRSRGRARAFGADGQTEDELARVMAQAEAQFVYRLQSVGGFGGKSDQLNAYNVFLGEPESLQRDLDRYLSATPKALAEAAHAHLQPDARVA